MSNTITLTASDGSTVQFVDEIRASGGMKDVYFAPNKDYVVAFFRTKADAATRDRLTTITEVYRDRFFNQEGGDYLKNLFCWPTAVVEHNGRLGVVAPFYRDCFFFEHGSRDNDSLSIRGKDKDGKWFATASHRSKRLDPRELGDWMKHLKVCLLISRAVRRMHAGGLSHSDLSYKNVLIDPTTGQACLIDIDGLVVPGKYPPDVAGTPDFIAPEVVMTSHLARNDKSRKLPSRLTDLHALAVLVYIYLLYRHPLKGDKVHDPDDSHRDDELAMGERALFVEHPTDSSNRIQVKYVKKDDLPWKDTNRIPYTVTGPYLSELFRRAFIDGLKNPAARPTADEWETALVKTVDLLQPCANKACDQKWFAFDNSTSPKCPFCGTPHRGTLPVLNLYSSQKPGSFRPDHHRLMVYSNQSIFAWHVNRNIFPNERLNREQTKRVGYFVEHQGAWYLVNEGMPQLRDVGNDVDVPIGGKVRLEDGGKILLSKDIGGRLISIQLVAS